MRSTKAGASSPRRATPARLFRSWRPSAPAGGPTAARSSVQRGEPCLLPGQQSLDLGLLLRDLDTVSFTSRGEAEARVIVRRHRLAERRN